MTWSKRFDTPIALPGGTTLATLHDARAHILSLPPAEHDLAHWRNAIEALLLVVEHKGPPMFARIAMMQALHHGRPAPPRAPRRNTRRYRIIR